LEVSFSHDHFYTYRKKATFDIPLKKPKYEILHIPFILFSICSFAQKRINTILFFRKNKSASYQETIAYYKLLADDFPTVEMKNGIDR
jgi:hypothetical protein